MNAAEGPKDEMMTWIARGIVAMLIGSAVPVMAEEPRNSSPNKSTPAHELRQYGVPEGGGWPWHFPPIDPAEPPLSEGMLSLWLTYHLASLIATDNAAWDGQEWKPQAWCMRWDDGCTVCERSKVGEAAVCRNNRQNPHPEMGCKPALRHSYCTGMNLRAFERACPVRLMATYGQTDRMASNPLPRMLRNGIRRFSLKQYSDAYKYNFHALEAALNNDNGIIGFYAGQDGKKYTEESASRIISTGYLSVINAKYAAEKYLINRLEAKRYFICAK